MKDSRDDRENVLARVVDRRVFLTGSTSVAVASGVAAAALGRGTGSENKSTDPRRLEYRETEHIRKFYALSRF